MNIHEIRRTIRLPLLTRRIELIQPRKARLIRMHARRPDFDPHLPEGIEIQDPACRRRIGRDLASFRGEVYIWLVEA